VNQLGAFGYLPTLPLPPRCRATVVGRRYPKAYWLHAKAPQRSLSLSLSTPSVQVLGNRDPAI
jgi:hypothetical protein